MKRSIILIGVIAAMFTFNQNSYAQTYVLDSLYNDSWNPGTMGFDLNVRHVYSYDIDTNRVEENQQIYGGTWGNFLDLGFTYNASGNVTEELDQVWISGAYVVSNKNDYTYNGNGDLTQIISQFWDAGNSVWVNSSENILTYDGQNRLFTNEAKNWDGISSFQNASEDIYTYDLLNRLKILYNMTWNVVAYDSSYKHTYMYDLNDSVIQRYGQQYNLGTNGWDQFDQQNFHFDGQGRRDSSNNLSWDGINFDFYGTYSSYYYGGNGKLSKRVDYQTSFNGGVQIDTIGRDRYMWKEYQQDTTTGNGIKELSKIELSVYPNPSTDFISFTLNSGASSIVRTQVYDALGRLVCTTNYGVKSSGELKMNEDIRQLPQGAYTLNVYAGDKQYSSSFVKN